MADSGPTVILVAGVNGCGKTTSIAKLAYILSKNDKKVLVAACDTFRAAAVEQLTIWAERIGVQIVRHKAGADPANFGFLAVDSAIANNQTASLDFLAKVPGVPEFIYTKYEDMGYKNTLGPHAKTLIQQFLLEKTLN